MDGTKIIVDTNNIFVIIDIIDTFEKGGKIMSDATKRINITIPENLHRELKISAAKEGITLGQYVTNAISEKIEKQKDGK